MPGFLLTTTSIVLCAHGGKAQPTAPNPRVKIMGQPTVMQPTPWVVAGCTLPPPPAANGPCVTAQWLLASVRIKSNGMPLLLQDGQTLCAPTATPLNVVFAQSRVKGT